MLNTAAVAELARPIVERALAPLMLAELRVEETADSEGQAALDVLAVADDIVGDGIDAEVEASIAIQRALQKAGETRYAFVRFTTPGALAETDAEQDDE